MNLYTTRTMASASECPLRVARDPVPRGHCWWCGGALPKRRLRWCSDECLRVYQDNHEWASASWAAKKRDGKRCVRCGADGERVDGWFIVVALEVNHIEPRRGAGYDPGCHHHLDGLETLCRPCHVSTTMAQLREWRPPRPRIPREGLRPERPPEAASLPLWGALDDLLAVSP